jgi:hypothetical protein
MLDNRVDKSRESGLVTKHAGVDGVEDLLEFGIELIFTIVMGVAEVLDVLGEVAEEEDVLVAGLASYFDLFIGVS